MKKKFLSLAIVFMLTIAGVVGSLCLNNTMATYGATTTKTYKMKSDFSLDYVYRDYESLIGPTSFTITASGTTITGSEYDYTDDVIQLFSEDKSKCIMYSDADDSYTYNMGWYVGVKKDTSSTSTTFASSIKYTKIGVGSPTISLSDYTYTKLSEAPTFEVTDDETSTFSQFLQANSEPNQLPSTGIMFDNKNYTMPLIIIGSMLALTGVAMLVLVKSKKHN